PGPAGQRAPPASPRRPSAVSGVGGRGRTVHPTNGSAGVGEGRLDGQGGRKREGWTAGSGRKQARRSPVGPDDAGNEWFRFHSGITEEPGLAKHPGRHFDGEGPHGGGSSTAKRQCGARSAKGRL